MDQNAVKQLLLTPWYALSKFFFKSNEEYDVNSHELRGRTASRLSTTSKGSRKISAAMALFEDYKRKSGQDKIANEGQYKVYNDARRPRDFQSLIYREGPMSVKELGTNEIEPLPGELDIEIMFDLDELAPDSSNQKTSSRSLLVYFARLASAAEEGELIDFHFIQSLLDSGASLGITDVHGQSIMHAVVRDWNVDVARFIVERNADVNQADKYGRTPMHLAAACNHPDMLKYLINQSGDIESQTLGECQTPLHYAAKYGSVTCLQVLLLKGANINSKDFKLRTPLSLASEMGQEAAAHFLLSQGASSNIMDKSGNKCLAFMIEKMPLLAHNALDKLHEVDESARKQWFYLSDLEYSKSSSGTDVAKTVSQVVHYARNREIISHPVMVKLLDVKWELFGFKFMLAGLFVALTVAGLFTALTVTVATTGNLLYEPLEDQIWRIVVEIIYVIISATLFTQHVVLLRTKVKNERMWKSFRLADLKREKIYCHPRWPSDRKFLRHEIESVESRRSSVLRDPWDWFEIFAFVFNVILIIVHVVTVVEEDKDDIKYALNVFYCLNSFIVWFRVLKSLRSTRLMGDYIIMLGHVVSITVKFALLYVEILIPYVCSIWILFGGDDNAKKISGPVTDPDEKDEIFKLFSDVNNLLFYSWQLSANGNFDISAAFTLNEVAGKIIVAAYLGVTTILYFNLYIALVSHLYVREYQTVRSTALLTQAKILDRQEQMLSKYHRKQLKNKFKKNYNPMEETYNAKMKGSNNVSEMKSKMLDLKRRLDKTVRTRKLKDISNSYGKANERADRITELFNQLYHQQDRINDRLDHLREYAKKPDAKNDTNELIKDDARSTSSKMT